jgi:SAM-dependent methyltransferase
MHRSSDRDDPLGKHTEEEPMMNVAQRAEWNGETAVEWVRLQDRYDRMLSPWMDLLAERAAVEEGERVLDVGCGCGATTLDAGARCGPSGAAVGVDLSTPMVARAGERAVAAGLAHVRFEVGDAQEADFGDATFDVVISRLGVMFFDDPVAAFANLRAAVRPGGRLAALVWGPIEQQEWLMVPGAVAFEHVPFPELGGEGGPGTFALADAEHTAGLLARAGWREITVESHRRKMLMGGGGTLDETMDFIATGPGRDFLAGGDPEATRRAIDAIRGVFAERVTPQGVELDGTVLAVTAVC